MPLLVRTWNLFHGNAAPPERSAYLEQMVQLVSEGRLLSDHAPIELRVG